MNNASEVLLSLKPVTFRYRRRLILKESRSLAWWRKKLKTSIPIWSRATKKEKVYTVRYEAVNAMLLNEFLKAHRKVEKQGAAIAQLRSTVAQQQKEWRLSRRNSMNRRHKSKK